MENNIITFEGDTAVFEGFSALQKKGRVSFLPKDRLAIFVGHDVKETAHAPFTLDNQNKLSNQVLVRKIKNYTTCNKLEFFYVEDVNGYCMKL